MENEQPSAAPEQSETPRRRHGGRPWPKGVSGNPSGSKVSKRVTTLFEALADEFGGADLSATDRALLIQACRLLVRSERVKDTDQAVKCVNAARRIMDGLRKRAPEVKPQAALGLLRSRFAREAAS
jgi:hypothetical protein